MKVKLFLVAFVALLAAGYVVAAHLSGGAFPTPGLNVGGERAEVRRLALAFWEDIQFKDFTRAASYHTPEKRDTVDIPYLIERLFQHKPESLDFMRFEIVLAEVDSTHLRARVKTRVTVKSLLDEKIRDPEVMLYFHRDSADAPWHMELETSLRALEADKSKKH